MSLSDEIATRKTKAAALTRFRAADDPELIAHRQELKTLVLQKHVQEVVASFPPLTEAQIDRLTAILRTAPSAKSEGAAA